MPDSGLATVPAFEASVLLLLEPALNPTWASFVVDEYPGNWVMAGGAVIWAATIWNTGSKKNEKPGQV